MRGAVALVTSGGPSRSDLRPHPPRLCWLVSTGNTACTALRPRQPGFDGFRAMPLDVGARGFPCPPAPVCAHRSVFPAQTWCRRKRCTPLRVRPSDVGWSVFLPVCDLVASFTGQGAPPLVRPGVPVLPPRSVGASWAPAPAGGSARCVFRAVCPTLPRRPEPRCRVQGQGRAWCRAGWGRGSLASRGGASGVEPEPVGRVDSGLGGAQGSWGSRRSR